MIKLSLKKTFIGIIALIIAAVVGFAIFLMLTPTPQQVDTEPPKKIGILRYITATDPTMEGFKEGMEELGYKEGEDVIYIVSEVLGDTEKMPGLAREQIEQEVDVILALGTIPGKAALEETQKMNRTDIPIVFAQAVDAVQAGLAKDYTSSGNNATGIEVNFPVLTGKKLDFLRQLDPTIKKIGFIEIIEAPELVEKLAHTMEELEAQAPKEGFEIVRYPLTGTKNQPSPEAFALLQKTADQIKPNDIDAYFQIPGSVLSDPTALKILNDMTKRLKIPSAWSTPGDVEAGGLMAYGYDPFATGMQAAVMMDKVLQGAHPSDIPIEIATTQNLFVNMATAQSLDLSLSPSLLELIDVRIGE